MSNKTEVTFKTTEGKAYRVNLQKLKKAIIAGVVSISLIGGGITVSLNLLSDHVNVDTISNKIDAAIGNPYDPQTNKAVSDTIEKVKTQQEINKIEEEENDAIEEEKAKLAQVEKQYQEELEQEKQVSPEEAAEITPKQP